ncbi:hypothetical protein LXA43DRAFT_907301, partial [Ganoderma leucocontextum]
SAPPRDHDVSLMAGQRLRARCKGLNQDGTRCNVLVPCATALPFPRGGRLPFFCLGHLQEMLVHSLFYIYARHAKHLVDFVRTNLEPRTQVLLRRAMRAPPAKKDKAGYIYALKLTDARPDLVRIKVGRTVNIRTRLYQHRRRCPSLKPQLLGQYPSSTRPKACTVPFSDRLERLVHLELTDVAACSNPAGRTATRPRCPDCHAMHIEIFTFKRPPHAPSNWVWNRVVWPVFKRWGDFVSNHVV